LTQIFWPTLLAALTVISLGLGIAGVAGGSRVARIEGPDALMKYPAPASWLRRRPTSARWVQRIGRLYLMAAMALGTAAAVVGLRLSAGTPESAVCKPIAKAIMAEDWAGSPLTLISLDHHTGGCRIRIEDQAAVVWFTVSSAPPAGLIGEDFNHQRAQRERKGMTITRLSGIGKRALLAARGTNPAATPAVLFESNAGTTVVEINGPMVTPARIQKTVDMIRAVAPTHH